MSQKVYDTVGELILLLLTVSPSGLQYVDCYSISETVAAFSLLVGSKISPQAIHLLAKVVANVVVCLQLFFCKML